MRKKVFISIGFKGREELEIELEERNLKKRFYMDHLHDYYKCKFIDNFKDYKGRRNRNLKIYQKAMALKRLSYCDTLIYNKEDYEEFYGVKLEVDLAKKYNMNVYSLKWNRCDDYTILKEN